VPERVDLAVTPSPIQLLKGVWRPAAPFVMVNLLVFKEHASGQLSHMTGREAYLQYASSAGAAQRGTGSRMLWTGEISAQQTGVAEPMFQSVGCLEYSSPRTFLRYALTDGADMKARAAGLEGQWLIAATTMESGPAPAEDSLCFLELVSFADGHPEPSRPFRNALRRQLAEAGGRVIWRGQCDAQVLGKSDPPVDEVVVTEVPSAEALDAALRHPDVTIQRGSRERGLARWWTYRVHATELGASLWSNT